MRLPRARVGSRKVIIWSTDDKLGSLFLFEEVSKVHIQHVYTTFPKDKTEGDNINSHKKKSFCYVEIPNETKAKRTTMNVH